MVKKHYIVAAIYTGVSLFAFYYFLRHIAGWDMARIIKTFIIGGVFVALAVILMYYSSKSDD